MARFTRGSDAQQTLPAEFPQAQPKAATPTAGSAREHHFAKQRQQPRTNGYPGRCVKCQGWVEATKGTVAQRGGKWEVSHLDGECNVSAPAASAEAPTERNFSVPDGTYTIIWDNHYKTIKVRTQDQFADFMPGKPVLGYLAGADNDRDFTSFAHVDERGQVRIWKKHQHNENLREAVKVLLGDPKAASQAYARESGCCGVCGRTLTTPESIEAGIGPECRKKVGW